MPADRPRAAVILAAGQGVRMRSSLPKPLHEVGGRAMLDWALALAGEGAAVALSGRRREPLQKVADEIAKAGGKALVAVGDLGEQETAGRITQEIVKAFGRLDILVNNAGANLTERSWEKLTPERAKFVLDANLNSAFYCSAAALAVMRQQKDGLLIHTASWAGRFVGILPGPVPLHEGLCRKSMP